MVARRPELQLQGRKPLIGQAEIPLEIDLAPRDVETRAGDDDGGVGEPQRGARFDVGTSRRSRDR